MIFSNEEITGEIHFSWKKPANPNNFLKFTNPMLVENEKPKKSIVTPSPILIKSNVRCSELIIDRNMEQQGILDLISCPRMWKKDGKFYKQVVSPQPTHRCELQVLRKRLKRRLKEAIIRPAGICPCRMAIYSDIFDELIRQVTVSSSQRGLLMLRVKEENKMTMSTLKNLYEEAATASIQIFFELESLLQPIFDARDQLAEEVDNLKEELFVLQSQYDSYIRELAEESYRDDVLREDETKSWERTNSELQELVRVLKSKEPEKEIEEANKLEIYITDEDVFYMEKGDKMAAKRKKRKIQWKIRQITIDNLISEKVKRVAAKDLNRLNLLKKTTEQILEGSSDDMSDIKSYEKLETEKFKESEKSSKRRTRTTITSSHLKDKDEKEEKVVHFTWAPSPTKVVYCSRDKHCHWA